MIQVGLNQSSAQMSEDTQINTVARNFVFGVIFKGFFLSSTGLGLRSRLATYFDISEILSLNL